MDRAILHLMPGDGRRPLTPEEQDDVNDILDAAEAWAAGALPWYEAAKLGTIAYRGHSSNRYARFIAVWQCDKADRRRAHLLALIDEINRRSGYHITEQGMFTSHDDHQHDGAIRWMRANPTRDVA